MKKADIIEKLHSFPYDTKDYWVITGGAMVMYGIREETSDIDLGCTSELADRLEKDGFLYQIKPDGTRWFRIGSDIEVYENWLYESVELVDGIPVISIPGLIAMKQTIGREKDKRDLKLIEEYLHRSARTDLEK
ncbi:MAG: hypothetical protein IJM83_12220 [Firmicutes bacterium]|nr:hypothetical protein [Bacillota bacterium]